MNPKLSIGFMICFFIILFVSLMVLPHKANSHSWYPPDCCSGQDCAPVDKIEELSNGDLKITSVHGTTLVPKGYKKRPSEDTKEHICMRPYMPYDQPTPQELSSGLKKVLCYFVPMGS
jgi:hypothetical protein